MTPRRPIIEQITKPRSLKQRLNNSLSRLDALANEFERTLLRDRIIFDHQAIEVTEIWLDGCRIL